MSNDNAVLTVIETPLEVAETIQHVQACGCNTQGLSAAWKDQVSQSNVTGYYIEKHRMKYWSSSVSHLNEIFEMLSGWAFLAVPGIGRILIVGPLADWIANALPNAAIFEGMSAIGMGLHSVGISRSAIGFCEESLKDGKCILLLNGSADEVKRAKQIIDEYCGQPQQNNERGTGPDHNATWANGIKAGMAEGMNMGLERRINEG